MQQKVNFSCSCLVSFSILKKYHSLLLNVAFYLFFFLNPDFHDLHLFLLNLSIYIICLTLLHFYLVRLARLHDLILLTSCLIQVYHIQNFVLETPSLSLIFRSFRLTSVFILVSYSQFLECWCFLRYEMSTIFFRCLAVLQFNF